MENMSIVERAKRLELVDQALRAVDENMDTVVGQLKLLSVLDDTQIDDSKKTVNDEVVFLRVLWLEMARVIIATVAGPGDLLDLLRKERSDVK